MMMLTSGWVNDDVCVYMCTQPVCTSVCACRGHKLTLEIFLNFLAPWFLRQGLSMNLELIYIAKLAGQ